MESFNRSHSNETTRLFNYSPEFELVPPLDEETFLVIKTVFQIVITGAIALCGITANIINITVFFRSGILSDSNTVSLTGLALSDLLCCLFVLWGSVCLGIQEYFNNPELKWHVHAFYLCTSKRPRYVFTQITCFITAYIAIERFVAIVFPFKVKRIFTAKHTLFVMCCIFIAAIIADYPQLSLFIPKGVDDPITNLTILTYVYSGILFTKEMRLAFNNLYTTLRLLSFAVVIVCNATMIQKLIVRQKFKTFSTSLRIQTDVAVDNVTARHDIPISSTNHYTNPSTSDRVDSNNKLTKDTTRAKIKRHDESRIITMMCSVCTLFLLCYTPDIVIVVIHYILFMNHHWMVEGIADVFIDLLETINSSCNILIYFTMSSRYRKQLLSLMRPKV